LLVDREAKLRAEGIYENYEYWKMNSQALGTIKDDLARFQIIVKLPYPPLSVKRVKKLFDIDGDWYENKMLNTLVQACGRATRSKNDFSTTYILDGNVVNALKRTKNKLPVSFIDRIV
jgi:Rad3-related DNA helicase